MTIPRANPLTWAAFEILTSTQMNLVDVHTTEALDGLEGGVYALTSGVRGDGYFTLNAQAATAVPAGETALMHLQVPPNVANLHGLYVEAVSAVGIGESLGKFYAPPTLASGGVRGLKVQAAGNAIGIDTEGGNGTGAAAVVGGTGLQSTGGNGALGIRAYGGASTSSLLDAGAGIRVDGGEYSGGDWTGASQIITDFPHGVRSIGGNSDDTAESVAFLNGTGLESSSAGAGVYGEGGDGDAAGTTGGNGGIFQGAAGLSTLSTSSVRRGGIGAIGIGGEGEYGGGGHGIAGVGAALDTGVTRPAGTQGGYGGYFYGGTADANGGTLVNQAGSGIAAIGGANSGPDPEDKAGHGGAFVGGRATGSDTTDGGDGNGIQAQPHYQGNGVVKAVGASWEVYGAGVYGYSINLLDVKPGPAYGVVGIAKSRDNANIGMYSIAAQDNTGGATGICRAVVAVVPTAAGVLGSSAALDGNVIEDATPAAALRLSIPSAPDRGHIEAQAVPNAPSTATNGAVFFGQTLTSSLEGSMFLGRTEGSPHWSRIVDDNTPWLVRAWGTIRCNSGTETYTGYNLGIPIVNTTRCLVNLALAYDDILYTVHVCENMAIPGGTIYGRPVVSTKLGTTSFEVRMVNSAGALLTTLDINDFAFEVITVGKVGSIF